MDGCAWSVRCCIVSLEKNGELDSLERHENDVEDSNEDESVTTIQNDDV